MFTGIGRTVEVQLYLIYFILYNYLRYIFKKNMDGYWYNLQLLNLQLNLVAQFGALNTSEP